VIEIIWDGVVRSEVLDESKASTRKAIADAAKSYDWPAVLILLRENAELINTTRPDGTSLYAPLHQAAHGGAPVKVIKELIELGAWRTLQNARGERPIDVAEKHSHKQLQHVLSPDLKRRVPNGVLLKIQTHFHDVIVARTDRLIQQHGIRLPELEPLLEYDATKFWFPVPGMYGGFAYQLENDGVNAKLISESWCRVVGGSGQRHEITSSGSKLVDEGFV
jgi:hypothetical protein